MREGGTQGGTQRTRLQVEDTIPAAQVGQRDHLETHEWFPTRETLQAHGGLGKCVWRAEVWGQNGINVDSGVMQKL